MDLDNIRLKLGVDTAGWRSGLASASAMVSTFGASTGRQVDAIGSKWASLSSGMGKMGAASTGMKVGMAGAAAGVGLLAVAMAASIGPAIRFESAFATVKQRVSGTPEQLEAIRDGILDLSRVMPAAATEIAEVAAAAGQLGIAQSDVLEFAETMVMLGETTNMGAEEAAVGFARFLNITGSSAGTIDNIASSVVNLGNNMATTEGEILSFAERVAGAGALLGFTDDQIAATAATFSSLGINAEAGGTAVSRIWREMSIAAETGSDNLAVFADVAGVSADQFARLVDEEPMAAWTAFLGGMGEMRNQGGPVLQMLDDLGLDAIRVSDVLLRGSGSIDLFNKSNQLAAEGYQSASAHVEEYGKRVETTAARIEIFKNRVTALAIGVGTPALGGLAATVDGIGDAMERVAEIVGPAASELGELFANLAVGVGAVAVALGAPALAVAETMLVGLATSVEVSASALNAMGDVVPIVAAAFAAVGFGILATQVGALSVGFSTLPPILSTIAAHPALAALAGLSLVVGGVAKALNDAGAEARVMGDGLRASGIVDGVTTIESLTAAAEAAAVKSRELNESGSWLSETWSGLGQALTTPTTSLLDVAAGSKLVAASQEEAANAAKDLADDSSSLWFVLDTVAHSLGMTGDELQKVAVAAGIDPGGLLDADTYGETADAMKAATVQTKELATEIGVTTDALLAGEFTVTDYADSLDLAVDSLNYLAEAAKVDLNDLFDEKKMAAANAELRAMYAAFEQVAQAAGMTTDSFLEQKSAADALVAAHDAVEQAINGVRSAQEAQAAAAERVAAAQTSIESVDANIKEDKASVEDLAKAYGDLNAAYAASGQPVNEVLRNQGELRESFVASVEQYGRTRAEAEALFDAWSALTEAEAAELSVTGMDQIDLAERRAEDVAEAWNRDFIAVLSADMGVADEVFREALGKGEEWAVSAFIAAIHADDSAAQEVFERELANGASWAQSVWESTLEANGVPVRKAVQEATNEVNRFARIKATAKLAVDASGIAAAVSGAEAEMRRFERLRPVNINVNRTITERTIRNGNVGAPTLPGVGGPAPAPPGLLDPIKSIFGEALRLFDETSAAVADHLADLGRVPRRMLEAVAGEGYGLVLGNRMVGGMGLDTSKFGGPRGWGGVGWENVPGVFANGTMYAGDPTQTSSASMAAHEFAHAFDDLFGITTNSGFIGRLREIQSDPSMSNPYFQQEGPGGLSETFAEAFALQIENQLPPHLQPVLQSILDDAFAGVDAGAVDRAVNEVLDAVMMPGSRNPAGAGLLARLGLSNTEHGHGTLLGTLNDYMMGLAGAAGRSDEAVEKILKAENKVLEGTPVFSAAWYDRVRAMERFADESGMTASQILAKREEFEDNLFKLGVTSENAYLGQLDARLAREQIMSDEWVAIYEQRQQVIAEMEAAARSGYANMFRVGELSLDEYVTILDRWIAAEEEFTDEWMTLVEQRQQALADAEGERRSVTSNRFEVGDLGVDEYLDELDRWIAGEVKFTDAWMGLHRERQRVIADQARVAQEAARAAADAEQERRSTLTNLFEMGGVGVDEYVAELDRWMAKEEQFSDAWMALYDRRDKVLRDLAEAADPLNRLTKALDGLSTAAGRVSTALGLANTALDSLYGRDRGVMESNMAMLDAVESVNKILDYSGEFSMEDPDSRQNLQTLIRMGDAMREYALAVAASGVSTEEARDTFAAMSDEFGTMAGMAGMPLGEIERLQAMLFGVPDEVVSQIVVEGQAQADAAAQKLEQWGSTVAVARLEVDSTAAVAGLEAATAAFANYQSLTGGSAVAAGNTAAGARGATITQQVTIAPSLEFHAGGGSDPAAQEEIIRRRLAQFAEDMAYSLQTGR